jgi:hypothetical protein
VPGSIVAYSPKAKLSEALHEPQDETEGHLPHGIDIDRNTGVIWTGLNSGHYAEFDRRKCQGPL